MSEKVYPIVKLEIIFDGSTPYLQATDCNGTKLDPLELPYCCDDLGDGGGLPDEIPSYDLCHTASYITGWTLSAFEALLQALTPGHIWLSSVYYAAKVITWAGNWQLPVSVWSPILAWLDNLSVDDKAALVDWLNYYEGDPTYLQSVVVCCMGGDIKITKALYQCIYTTLIADSPPLGLGFGITIELTNHELGRFMSAIGWEIWHERMLWNIGNNAQSTGNVDCSGLYSCDTIANCEDYTEVFDWFHNPTEDYGWTAVNQPAGYLPGHLWDDYSPPRAINTKRDYRGFEVVSACIPSSCLIAAATKHYDTPFNLCQIQTDAIIWLNPDDHDTAHHTGNTTVLGIFYKSTTVQEWTLLSSAVLGINFPNERRLFWHDEVSPIVGVTDLIVAHTCGGSYAGIPYAHINLPETNYSL